MKTVQIPFDKQLVDLEVNEKNLIGVLRPKQIEKQEASESEIVLNALNNPIGQKPLCELAKGKNNIVIVTSDHTRPVPSSITMPLILKEIRKGNSDAKITILIATGLHRRPTDEEMLNRFGKEIIDNEHFEVNDAFNKDQFVNLGVLPSGAEFNVNKVAVDADLLITEGFIEPHFFAGFSGGRKSILPGICSKETVNENHSYKAIASPYAKAGVLENNPIHIDMVAAARRVNVQFIINVVLDPEKKVIAAFAGDLEKAHYEGVTFAKSLCEVKSEKADIVITSNGGYPLDQNLYQSPKAVATAEACAKEGAVLIMSCGCRDGVGGSFFEKLIQGGTVDEIDEKLSKIPPKETIPEQWCAQIYSRILKKHKLILVSLLDDEVVRSSNMIPAHSINEALKMAIEMKGEDASVLVIPDGVSVLAI